ncbi:MAG: sigma 54-interacting transcriptional regulator [Myxococcota bacterium]
MQGTTLELYASTQDLLLELAGERELSTLLELVVTRLAAIDPVALARVWLLEDDAECDLCAPRAGDEARAPSLHLVASAGASRRDGGDDWRRIDGEFHRCAVGERKVGSCAETTEAVSVRDVREDASWISRPDWAEAEGILGFGGQPLVFRGEILGVLGVFTRAVFDAASLSSLRVVADHVAAALATARAFEENAVLRRRLEVENAYLREDLEDAQAFGDILGTSPAIRDVARQIQQVAPTDASVLILGESGSGKELVAREVHRRSPRAEAPLVRVNCASVPKELYESEFFGHVRGAFTGAIKDRVGRFAAAHRGTLFLDEVGEIPLELQSKLLRVLQEGQFERVGEDRTQTVDVRIVAATNRDLAVEVAEGRFREDLYYRLNVFPIEMPPLRARREDIPLLADHFLARLTRKHRRAATLDDAGRRALSAYDWPGNVRELQNAIERAVITASDGGLRVLLPEAAAPKEGPGEAAPDRVRTDAEIRALERRNLLAAVEQAEGRVYGEDGAAALLGLKPTTVASRLAKIRREDAGQGEEEER